MFKRKEKAFTLIELIAGFVIMAIIALIVTPLIMTIIKKARISADKRSIDVYGRSIELAITGYLLDTGKFATDINQLTIEYSGDNVTCETTQINSDSSVYLAGCSVAGRSIEGYTYGFDKLPKSYTIGDIVSYNGVDYYVIENSDTKESTVTLLKAEPLTVDEVNLYGVGHINRYTSSSIGTVYDSYGYGALAYYTSETCGYINNNWVYDGCKIDYSQSDIKHVVDAWKNAKAPAASEARLITKDEVFNNFEVEERDCCGGCGSCIEDYVKNVWMYGEQYSYWTSSRDSDSEYYVWTIHGRGGNVKLAKLNDYYNGFGNVVRPVIVLDKSVLSS